MLGRVGDGGIEQRARDARSTDRLRDDEAVDRPTRRRRPAGGCVRDLGNRSKTSRGPSPTQPTALPSSSIATRPGAGPLPSTSARRSSRFWSTVVLVQFDPGLRQNWHQHHFGSPPAANSSASCGQTSGVAGTIFTLGIVADRAPEGGRIVDEASAPMSTRSSATVEAIAGRRSLTAWARCSSVGRTRWRPSARWSLRRGANDAWARSSSWGTPGSGSRGSWMKPGGRSTARGSTGSPVTSRSRACRWPRRPRCSAGSRRPARIGPSMASSTPGPRSAGSTPSGSSSRSTDSSPGSAPRPCSSTTSSGSTRSRSPCATSWSGRRPARGGASRSWSRPGPRPSPTVSRRRWRPSSATRRPSITLHVPPLDRDDGVRLVSGRAGMGAARGVGALGARRRIAVLARPARGSARATGETSMRSWRPGREGSTADANLLLGTLAILGRPVDALELEGLVGWPADRCDRATADLVERGLAIDDAGTHAARPRPDPRRRHTPASRRRRAASSRDGSPPRSRNAREAR